MYCWKKLKHFNILFYDVMFFIPYAFLSHSFNNVGNIWWPKSFFFNFPRFNMILYPVPLLYFARLQIPISVYKNFHII